MKVEVKKVDAVKRELRFQVPKERVAAKYNEVYSALGKIAKVRGFRPGKVPRHILETHHGAQAKDEVIRKLIPEVYQEGIQQENILPLDLPEITDLGFKDGALTFTAKLDIKPEVKIDHYKGIKVKRKSAVVTEEEMAKTLGYFKKGQGGEAQAEVAIDDAFAHGLGYPSLAEFKNSLKRQLEMDRDRHNRLDIENQIIESLLKSAKLAVPESLVKRQIEHRIEDEVKHMKSHGHSAEEIEKKISELRKDLRAPVEREVKVYLILDRIAKAEKLDIMEGASLPAKVMEFLLKEAKWEEA